MKTREIAYCGMFGSLALALPSLFHATGLGGAMFLPMYWPLVALAFMVSTVRAAAVAALVPLVGAVLTGMPLLWPPLAGVMSMELLVQVTLIGLLGRSAGNRARGTGRALVVLAVVLVAGRFLHAGLVLLLAEWFELPKAVLAGASFVAGWPGVLCMLVFVPVFVGAISRKDGVCEVRFLKALRALHLPEGVVLVCAQVLRWFEALSREAEVMAKALELRSEGGRGLATREGRGVEVLIEGLRVRYPGASEDALSVDRLEVKAGGKLALMGVNGCGKTTTLAVLAGLVKYDGRVEIDGVEPKGKALKGLRRRMGVLFENPDDQFLYPTVREDVGMALRRAGKEKVEERVDELMRLVGLPTGNRPVAALSRGQRQRAAIAGLLAAEPELLLLDEPTSALDEAETVRLAKVLRALPATVIAATHDRAFAQLLMEGAS